MKICKALGTHEFLLAEYSYSQSIKGKNNSKRKEVVGLLKYFKEERLTTEDSQKLKSYDKKDKNQNADANSGHFVFYLDSGKIMNLQEYEQLISKLI